MAAQSGLSLIDREDLDIIKEWKFLVSKINEFDDTTLFLGRGKEIHRAIMCRPKRNARYKSESEQNHSATYEDKNGDLKLIHCYKFKV